MTEEKQQQPFYEINSLPSIMVSMSGPGVDDFSVHIRAHNINDARILLYEIKEKFNLGKVKK